MTTILAPARSRAAHGTSLILLTMSLGVLIAQIDTSVVNLAVKEIGAKLDAGVTALQWVVDAYNLVYASLLPSPAALTLKFRGRVFVDQFDLRHRRSAARHRQHAAAGGRAAL
jgi:MFS transporter, DHA2 family, methylenomycin A resistance protein